MRILYLIHCQTIIHFHSAALAFVLNRSVSKRWWHLPIDLYKRDISIIMITDIVFGRWTYTIVTWKELKAYNNVWWGSK